VLKLARLEELAERWPHHWSGGASSAWRALAEHWRPASLLLMDALSVPVDAITVNIYKISYGDLVSQTRKAVMFITHDIEEGDINLADRCGGCCLARLRHSIKTNT